MAGYAFFVGLALGLLAKGPVALVLTFMPIGAWTLWTRSWRAVWSGLPWITGTALAALLAVPWYWAAERASPGFLDYFLIGEHWKRFVEPGWRGDLYGAAHARPRGTIWVFWIAAALPWSVPAIGWLVRAALVRRDALRAMATDRWQSYLLLWTLAPMLFFTVSGNVLATYVLPGLPAFALLVAGAMRPDASDARAMRPAARQAIATGFILSLMFVAGIVVLHQRFDDELSHKALVRMADENRRAPGERLIYLGQSPISAEFYSKGKALLVPDLAALRPYLEDAPADFIVVRSKDFDSLPDAMRARLVTLGSFGEYRLLRDPPR